MLSGDERESKNKDTSEDEDGEDNEDQDEDDVEVIEDSHTDKKMNLVQKNHHLNQ